MLHATSRFVITTSTENRVPSAAVKTSADGDGGAGLGDGVGEGDGDGCGWGVEGLQLGALDNNANETNSDEVTK